MMKALILAAGFGTRLLPWTAHTPKPLFTIDGLSLIDRLINQLKDADCTAIAVNTHHLSDKLEGHIHSRDYGVTVMTRREPEILGTGGAIKNLSDFWDEHPFLVVNADIYTDIDLSDVFNSHVSNDGPATLVLHDAPPLNSVAVNSTGQVTRFLSKEERLLFQSETYTFTGIQVLEPRLLSLIPDNAFYSSIDVYKALIRHETPPIAYFAKSRKWKDLGTPDRYIKTVRNEMATSAFQKAFGHPQEASIDWSPLSGDGSDRIWYRLQSGHRTLVAADHGITVGSGSSEVKSFVTIGRHLKRRGLPVPELHRYDLFSGWVFMEDMGDTHLQAVVNRGSSPEGLSALYKSVLDTLIRFSTAGMDGFDTGWTYQGAAYDRTLILDRECAYFVDAFLKGYLGLDVSFRDFASGFDRLADGALSGAVIGLMHRDFQSRNILIHRGTPQIIDFQGARMGPIQYDVASLLIDPYAGLSEPIQEGLYTYTVSRLSNFSQFDADEFRRCYEFCRITRNLQMLGAFGYLSRVKGKRKFEQYISPALDTLKRNLVNINLPETSNLLDIVKNL